ncbi:hypothetical protein [Micromonospora sp. IBSANI012]|uniref:hypothetical protein n=1 Tax=Micromonospora sp. IBSANI012 TaxID=3457761 RepID=UPI00405A0D1A
MRVFSYRSARPWLIRLGLLGQLVLLTSLGATPAHASPAGHHPATAAVAVSGSIGAAARAVDTGPPPGNAAPPGGTPMALVGDTAAYGSTDTDSDDSSPLNGPLRSALAGGLGGLLVGLAWKVIRVARERREQRASPPPPPIASSHRDSTGTEGSTARS